MNRVRTALELRLDQAASPQRVEAAAHMFAQMLATAYPDLPEGAVTMVVTNFEMGAGVRPRTPEGRKAVQQVLRFMQNPTRELQRKPALLGIARAALEFQEIVGEGVSAQLLRPGAKRPVATLDASFSDVMHRLTTGEDRAPPARGFTTVFTRVLRVGRQDEEKHVRARIRLDGRPQDVRVAERSIARVFDAAKHGREVPLTLDAVWVRDASGRLRFDGRRTTITDVDLDWKPVEGTAAVELLSGALPGLTSATDAQILEILNETRGGAL